MALAIHSSGRKREERHEAGVGFAIKSELVGKLTGLPNDTNDRLRTLRLPFVQPSSVPKLILLGDFNAKVGTDHQTWERVLGSEGVGKCNSNGLLILRKCAEHDLLITNTVFKLPNGNKTAWMHPRSKHGHFIYYVIVRITDRHDVRVTKTMCGADCWIDHRLVVSKLNLRIQPAQESS